MRRALRHQLPALSHWFGLQPWDLERLAFAELRVYLDALKAIAAAHNKG